MAMLSTVSGVARATSLDYALYFGEVDEFQYVEAGKNASFDTNEITIEAWIKPTSIPTGTHVREGRSTIIWNGDQSSGKDPYIFYINEFGELEAHVDFENGTGMYIVDSSNPLVLNAWHHVALNITDTIIAIALDGIITETISHNNGVTVKDNSHVAIGRHRHYKNAFGGFMDEMRIWDIALSEDELAALMYEEVTGDEKDLVAYWSFNEGSGQMVGDSTSNQINGRLGSYITEDDGDPSWMASDRPTGPIPEPTTILLLGLGILGFTEINQHYFKK